MGFRACKKRAVRFVKNLPLDPNKRSAMGKREEAYSWETRNVAQDKKKKNKKKKKRFASFSPKSQAYVKERRGACTREAGDCAEITKMFKWVEKDVARGWGISLAGGEGKNPHLRRQARTTLGTPEDIAGGFKNNRRGRGLSVRYGGRG